MESEDALVIAEFLENIMPGLLRVVKANEYKRLSKYGLTMPQFFAIALLEEKGSCMMKQMGEELDLSLGTITGIVDRLIRQGLADRVYGTEDRRVVKAALTKKGADLVEKLREQRIEALSEKLELVEKDDIEVFLNVMHTIITGLYEKGDQESAGFFSTATEDKTNFVQIVSNND